jgi:outer membrane protein assembly factor BamE (lipoprotein component of BamABCDE complex)
MLLAGCLISGSSNESVTGKYVAEETFDQIKPGKTTAGWVKATLGEPSEETHVDESNTDVWKYSYTIKKQSSGAVFLLFGASTNKEQPKNAFVEIKDGIVTNKWRG